jgi:cysteine-rich repeat protein
MGRGRSRAARLLLLGGLLLFSTIFEAVAAACGNGVLEESEECEDGNVFAGDGCSQQCQCEQDPCSVVIGAQASSRIHLASVVSGLRPGATLTLAAGSRYRSFKCKMPGGRSSQCVSVR